MQFLSHAATFQACGGLLWRGAAVPGSAYGPFHHHGKFRWTACSKAMTFHLSCTLNHLKN